MVGKTILILKNFEKKEFFEIIEIEGKYSLLFKEWNYAERPYDYIDPITADESYENCLRKLYEIQLKQNQRDQKKIYIDQLTEATREAIKGEKDKVEIEYMGSKVWRKARKKPIIIEFREPIFEVEKIKTKEGTLIAKKGEDFIIKGIEGELYPIKKKIFHKIYEIIEDE